jgi:probable HAF family extracellular repeat protein
LGTFGGPDSTLLEFQITVNNEGVVAAGADTSMPDPLSPHCFNFLDPPATDCFVQHGARFENGVLTDLGTLPGGYFSFAQEINDEGLIAGSSENGQTDPLTGTPAFHSVLWRGDKIIDLGALDGGSESQGIAINDRDQVVGYSQNTTPEALSISALFGANYGTQSRAFLWEKGVLQDLGTLGGNDAYAVALNESGQIIGFSYSDSTPNLTTGFPTLDPFIWESGKMTDIGTLGGKFGLAFWINERGQVVGQSNLAGDTAFHPFLWERGKLIDLGTLGGNTGFPSMINNAGQIVGLADTSQSNFLLHHAFFWKEGRMIDLGTTNGDPCSIAHAINSEGVIVGASDNCVSESGHAFVSDNGAPLIDLNTLIPANSSLTLVRARFINDRGEIAGIGVPPGVPNENVETQGHAFLLIPCDDDQDNAAVPASQTATMPPSSSIGNSLSHPVAARSPTMTVKGRFHNPYTMTQPKPTNY